MINRAARSQPTAFLILLGAAAVAWWSTAGRMAGMDAAPGINVGTIGWFTVTWTVMMAAMMLPSLAPAVAASAGTARVRAVGRTVRFAGGYLLIWTLAGLVVYAILAVGKHAAGLAWGSGGRWLSAGVLILAAGYELTPMKRAFLMRCRCPPATASSRSCHGAVFDGMSAGVRCLACSWALMAALFALGVMSLTWMALVAVLVAFQKLAPWPRAGIAFAAAVLTAIAVGVAASPQNVPGLVVPSSNPSMATMSMSKDPR